jgi:N-acetylmuramoyl-L-alanine amidase
MRTKGTLIQQIVLGLALLAALCWNLAQANEINRLDLTAGANGTRAELHLQAAPSFKTFRLSQPERLVVDLSGVDAGKPLQLPMPAGLVKAVRTGRPAESTIRIVFDLNAAVAPRQPRLETGEQGVRLVLEWPAVAGSIAEKPSAQPLTAVVPSSAGSNVPASAPASPDRSPAISPTAPKPTATTPMAAASVSPEAPAAANIAANAPNRPASNPAAANTNPAPTSAVASPASVAAVAAPSSSAAESSNEAAPAPAKPTPAPPMPRNLSGRSLVIAIDAGHGGQDPGAIGPTGKREKDVTLAIARELARQVNATPGLKAVLTRDSDMFLPLTRRTQLARQAKADMFISIHADAAENRAAKGSSVYVLSLRGASSQRARWLADKENASDLIGGHAVPKSDNTLTSVLLDLTQSGQMRASETAATHVLGGLKEIGNNHKPNIERANFAVLRTSDMPAMLVETAFISNADEERRLIDPAFQRKLAQAVLNGIDTYFQRQPPPGTLYAARANAAEAAKTLAQAGAAAETSAARPAPARAAPTPSAKAGASKPGAAKTGSAMIVANPPLGTNGAVGSPD